ncbi:MAG: carbohydrate ABC transporter permease [Spirochaetales bacterium]|nr:carbohydrate ABC transporter permease [Spirochaetales bacterium]
MSTLNAKRLFAYAVILFFVLICILPFYIMVINATRSNNQVLSGVSLLPGQSTVDNFKNLIFGKIDPNSHIRGGGLNIPQGFLNSLIIAVSSTVLSGYFSALTAFSFVIYRFKGKKFLWSLILAVIMVPTVVGLVGFYQLISNLNMIDTYWPLILPAIASPFAVFFLRQYMISSIPLSLIEASRIDGASEIRIFHKIVLPLSMPGIATISILGFLGSWNSYLLPLIVLNNKQLFTMPLLIQQLNTTLYNRDFGAMSMGIAISIVPILLMFIFFSKFLIEGISSGGVKE